MKYKHIFFDLDGTLWDFYRNSTETLSVLYQKYGLHNWNIKCKKFTESFHELNESLWRQFSENKISKYNLRNTRFPSLFSMLNIDNDKLAKLVSEEYIRSCPSMPHLIPNAVETLNYLYPRYNLHIITNGFADVAHRKLNNSGIINYFRSIITPDIANSRKPETGIFKFALGKADAVTKDAIMIGNDLESDIMGAHFFGIDQIYFNPNNNHSSFRPTFVTKELIQLKNIL